MAVIFENLFEITLEKDFWCDFRYRQMGDMKALIFVASHPKTILKQNQTNFSKGVSVQTNGQYFSYI